MGNDDLIPVTLHIDDNDEWDVWPVEDIRLQGIMDQRARTLQQYPGLTLPTGEQVFMLPRALVERYNRACEEMAAVQNLIDQERKTAPTVRMVELAYGRGFRPNV